MRKQNVFALSRSSRHQKGKSLSLALKIQLFAVVAVIVAIAFAMELITMSPDVNQVASFVERLGGGEDTISSQPALDGNAEQEILASARSEESTSSSNVPILEKASMQKESLQSRYTKLSEIFSTEDLCQLETEYRGILKISNVIRMGATGTFFFQSVVDAIIFAELHNLYPFIWMDKIPHEEPCFDIKHHWQNVIKRNFTHPSGKIANIPKHSPNFNLSRDCKFEPDHPNFRTVKDEKFSLKGNGVWQTYFEPTPVPFGLPCFKTKPAFELERKHYFPGMHYCSKWAIKGWKYAKLIETASPEYFNMSTREWLNDNRQRAANVVERYFKPQSWLQERIDNTFVPPDGGQCLAVHIRLTDKAAGRKRLGLDAYLPYIEAYVKAFDDSVIKQSKSSSPSIFLATDDASTSDLLVKQSSIIMAHMIHTQPNLLLSTGTTATFDAFKEQRHRLNTETLVDIYSLSKCQFIVHGYSAVPEAAFYLNPMLLNNSINIEEEDELPSPKEFQDSVASSLQHST